MLKIFIFEMKLFIFVNAMAINTSNFTHTWMYTDQLSAKTIDHPNMFHYYKITWNLSHRTSEYSIITLFKQPVEQTQANQTLLQSNI